MKKNPENPALHRVKETIFVPVTLFKQTFNSPRLQEQMRQRKQEAALGSEQPPKDLLHDEPADGSVNRP